MTDVRWLVAHHIVGSVTDADDHFVEFGTEWASRTTVLEQAPEWSA
jgi:hypothetical protein